MDTEIKFSGNQHSEKKGKNILFIISGSLSMFLWGMVLYLSVSVYDLEPLPPGYGFLYPIMAALSLLTGNLFFGHISDIYGRKIPFILSSILSSSGIMFASISQNYVEMSFSIFLANFSLGGEETVLLSYIFELFQNPLRSRLIIWITNMANAGVFFTAVSLFFLSDNTIQIRDFLGLSSLIILVLILMTRLRFQESEKWIESRKNGNKNFDIEEKAKEVWNYSGRHFRILSDFEQLSTGTVIITGFFLINIYFGYIYSNEPYYVSIITTIAGTLSGIILGIFSKRLPHKIIPLISFPTMAILVVSAAILSFYSLISMGFLIVILTARSFMSEIGWGSRDLLQTELTFTEYRSRHISYIRSFSYTILIFLYYVVFVLHPSLSLYLIIISVVEITGALGAIAWYFRGVETGRKDIS